MLLQAGGLGAELDGASEECLACGPAQTVLEECLQRVSCKSASYRCLPAVSCKNVREHCFTTVYSKSVLQEPCHHFRNIQLGTWAQLSLTFPHAHGESCRSSPDFFRQFVPTAETPNFSHQPNFPRSTSLVFCDCSPYPLFPLNTSSPLFALNHQEPFNSPCSCRSTIEGPTIQNLLFFPRPFSSSFLHPAHFSIFEL